MKALLLKRFLILLGILLISTFSILSLYAVLTNPYHTFSFVQRPFIAEKNNGEIILRKDASLFVIQNPFATIFSWYISGFHLLTSRYFGSQPIHGSVAEI